MKNKLNILILCGLLALSGTACKLLQSRGTLATLDNVQAGVVATMNEYGKLYRAGKVSAAERQKVHNAYAAYQAAYGSALIVVGYDKTASAPDELIRIKDELLAILNPLISGGK